MGDKIKIDLQDKKLIYYLSMDARLSHSQLSRKIGLSKNAVKYRIERLKRLGVIHHFASIVNLGSIKITTFTLLLKFNEDIYDKPEIIEFFKEHPFADWVVTLSGHWDIFVEMASKNIKHMHDLVKEMISKFGDKLNTYKLFLSNDTLRVEHLVEDFYNDLKLESLPLKERTPHKHKIDFTDMKILQILNEDSSLHYLEIARRLNLTIDIVRYRMKNLLDKFIIIKFFAEINLKKLGYTEYLFFIKLRNVSSEKFSKIRKSIQTNPNISYAFFDVNNYSIVFNCNFNGVEDVDTLSRKLQREFNDIIETHEYLLVKEQILFNLFPRGIMSEFI